MQRLFIIRENSPAAWGLVAYAADISKKGGMRRLILGTLSNHINSISVTECLVWIKTTVHFEWIGHQQLTTTLVGLPCYGMAEPTPQMDQGFLRSRSDGVLEPTTAAVKGSVSFSIKDGDMKEPHPRCKFLRSMMIIYHIDKTFLL